jgi:hypothetical protein
MRLAGRASALTKQGASRQATHLYLANLAATTQQKDNEQNWNRYPEKPKQDVSRSADFLDSLGEFHGEMPLALIRK